MRRLPPYIILLLFCIRLAAQQLPFVHYTPKNGLVSNRARQIWQDKKGRLYITTFGGLSVYDGARFTNYTTDNGLITSLVNDVMEMGDDSVWVVPNGRMIHYLVHGQLKDLETSDRFYPVINQLLKTQNGTLFAVADEGLFRFEQSRFIKIPLPGKAGKDEGQFLTRAATLDKYIFLLSDPYLDKFPGPGNLLVYDLETKRVLVQRPQTPFNFITLTPDKEIWLSSAAGIQKLDLEKLKHTGTLTLTLLPKELQPPAQTTPAFIYFDRQHDPWVSTPNGVYTIDHVTHTRQSYDAKNGLPTGTNTSIYQDREGTMWFTNEETGISKLAGKDIQLIKEPLPGFSPQIVYSHPNSDSVWFFDTQTKKLLLLAGERQTLFYCNTPLASTPMTIIMSPVPYLITQHQIYRLTLRPGKRYSAVFVCSDTLSSFGSSVEDSHGNLFVLSNQLTAILSGRIVRRPLSYFVDQPVIDDHGNLWIATRLNQLLTSRITLSDTGYTLQPLQTIDTRSLPFINSRSLAIDKNGRVWLGTRDHGLFCLTVDKGRATGWKQWTASDGLAGDFVTSLLCDKDNTIWVGTSAGLNKLSAGDTSVAIQNMTDGFQVYPFVLNIQAGPNLHWAATRSGFLKITDQQHAANPTPPPGILFSTILSGNKPVDPHQQIELSYRENNLHFYVATPSFVDEGHIRFQYRLEGGTNTEWRPPSTQSDINFDNLPPGSYRLYTKALFFGRYPDSEAHIDFRISPPWWQTTATKIAVFALLTAIILIGVRAYTRRKLEKQRIQLEKQQAVEKERTRIAMDMHDDLGAGLTRIKFITEDMAQKPVYAKDHLLLDHLRSSSNELVDKMGEIIWAMNEKNNTLEDLLFYLRAYAVDYCQDNGLDCDFRLPDPVPATPISGQTRRNIFLIVKESLHNVVKHAGARNVTITIAIDKQLTLQVTDDGKGFNSPSLLSGNGLLNMQYRAAAMKGTLMISYGKPATILLKIPL